jgi:methanogenic corrinoid protein MtbC1
VEVVSRIRSSQVVAFVVMGDVHRVGHLEVEEGVLSIVANVLLVAPGWELMQKKKREWSWHASVHLGQL